MTRKSRCVWYTLLMPGQEPRLELNAKHFKMIWNLAWYLKTLLKRCSGACGYRELWAQDCSARRPRRFFASSRDAVPDLLDANTAARMNSWVKWLIHRRDGCGSVHWEIHACVGRGAAADREDRGLSAVHFQKKKKKAKCSHCIHFTGGCHLREGVSGWLFFFLNEDWLLVFTFKTLFQGLCN